MSGELFVDTSGWYAIAVVDEPAQGAAVATLRERLADGARLVTTNLVVAETHALLLRRTGREPALQFVRTVRAAPNLVVPSDPELEARAVGEWLEPFRDQGFSYTDAVSFSVMKDRRIRDALALDRHFQVAGFGVVPG